MEEKLGKLDGEKSNQREETATHKISFPSDRNPVGHMNLGASNTDFCEKGSMIILPMVNA